MSSPDQVMACMPWLFEATVTQEFTCPKHGPIRTEHPLCHLEVRELEDLNSVFFFSFYALTMRTIFCHPLNQKFCLTFQ